MTVSPKIVCVSVLALVSAVLLPVNVAAQNGQIRRIGVASSGGVTEIRIETSKRLMPLTQVITDPDRLVIDFPDALPAAELHKVAVNQGEVKGVRASLLSAKPPMTRVVIDLKSAQEFRLVPTATAVTIRFLGSAPPLINPSAVAKSEPNAEPTSAPKPEPRHEVVTAPVPATTRPTLTVDRKPAPDTAAAPPVPTVAAAPATPVPEATPSKPALVATAKRPRITIERTSTENARPSLSTATVIQPAIEAVDAAPAPPPAPGPSGPAQIRKVSLLKSGGAMEFEIETSQRVVPTTQLITGPDRLVIDFPGSFPGPQLRALSVNQGEVKGVRAALLSNNPPVTRVVLDLKSPQEFQLFPSTRSVVVKLPGSTTPVHTPAPSASEPATEVASAVPQPAPEPSKKVTVTFQNGQLSIVSEKGSLADVLNEVRVQTGADIAIPAGAEQEQVVATIGPTLPRTAMSELLNGSRYNFIIVGTDADANQLERVVLTPKGVIDAADAPPPPSPQPVPVAQAAPPTSARSVRRSMMPTPPPPSTPVPPTDDAQPQGDSNPPPDTTPQPGDPQPAPN